MRLLLCLALIASVLTVAGCGFSQGPVPYGITVDQKGPVAVGDTRAGADKVGRARAQGIILVGFGDASIKAAAAEGKITRIHHVDCDALTVLGIYARYETIVYGE